MQPLSHWREMRRDDNCLSAPRRMSAFEIGQWVVEIKPKQARVFADHSNRNDVEQVISLLRNLPSVAYLLPPEISFSQVGWHVAH